jgi:hypothetical protein
LNDYFYNKIYARLRVFLLRKPAVSDYKAFSGKFQGRCFLLRGAAIAGNCAQLPISQAAASVSIAAGSAQPQQCFAREAH